MKEEKIREKLKLFASSTDHMWVRWHASDQVEVLESQGDCVLVPDTYKLDVIVSQLEIDNLRKFKEQISHEVSHHSFMIDFEGRQLGIQCIAKKEQNEVFCLWKSSKRDNSVALLQNAAHDFRSPLGSIIGFVNLLKNAIQSEKPLNDDDGKLYLDMIEKSANKALGLTAEIMELAEIESASYHLSVEKIIVEDFVKRYLETHRLITFKKGLKVECTSQSKKSALINEFKLTRALDNIMSNAVKFSRKGSVISFLIKEEGHSIKIIVKDQGIGMRQEMLDQLFEKFSKAKRKGLNGEASHGLGMSIVRQIMILHGGNVTVSSEEEVGTEVSLNLKIVE